MLKIAFTRENSACADAIKPYLGVQFLFTDKHLESGNASFFSSCHGLSIGVE